MKQSTEEEQNPILEKNEVKEGKKWKWNSIFQKNSIRIPYKIFQNDE